MNHKLKLKILLFLSPILFLSCWFSDNHKTQIDQIDLLINSKSEIEAQKAKYNFIYVDSISESKKDKNILINTAPLSDAQKAKNIFKNIKPLSESQKMKMFCLAFKHHSTAPYYVVITVKNLNTGVVKEMCTSANSLRGAISFEKIIDSYYIYCNDYPNRYFEFSSDKALRNIGFDNYSISELEEFKKTLNIGLILLHIKEGTLSDFSFGYYFEDYNNYFNNRTPKKSNNNDILKSFLSEKKSIEENDESSIQEPDWDTLSKQQKMFAHIMINHGIMVNRSCLSGSQIFLYTYENAKNE
jgi:hypothetical protein